MVCFWKCIFPSLAQSMALSTAIHCVVPFVSDKQILWLSVSDDTDVKLAVGNEGRVMQCKSGCCLHRECARERTPHLCRVKWIGKADKSASRVGPVAKCLLV